MEKKTFIYPIFEAISFSEDDIIRTSATTGDGSDTTEDNGNNNSYSTPWVGM